MDNGYRKFDGLLVFQCQNGNKKSIPKILECFSKKLIKNYLATLRI